MKINDQFNKSIEQTTKISRQEITNKSNNDNVSSANLLDQYIKNVSDLSTGWSVLSHLTSEQFFPYTRVYDEVLANEWIIDLSFLPEYLMPYLNIKIIYDSPEELIQRAFDNSLITVETFHVIQSTEGVNGSSSSTKTLIANIYVQQRISALDQIDLNIGDIKAKLLLSIQNPNNYV